MPLPDRVDVAGTPGLPDEAVREGLAEVRAMPHAGSYVTDREVRIAVEQGRVRIPQGMPTHAGTVKFAHCVNECLSCASVVSMNRKFETAEQFVRAWTERHYSAACASLRSVHRSSAGEGAADPDDMAVYVAWLYRNDLTPPQARQEHQFGDLPPNPGHSLKDHLDLYERQRMLTGGGSGDPRRRWNW